MNSNQKYELPTSSQVHLSNVKGKQKQEIKKIFFKNCSWVEVDEADALL